MHGALVFLTARTIRNSVTARLRRLRQPRYFLVGLGVALYFASMIFNRWQSGAFGIPPGYEGIARIAIGIAIAVLMALAWVLPISASLRMTLAEVHFLFPAPITRRDLLTFKMVRLLITAAATGVFFSLIVGPLRPLAALVFLLKTTAIMSLLALHEAGVSLYRLNRRELGVRADLRHLPTLAAAAALIAFGSFVAAWLAFAVNPGELFVLFLVALAAIAAVGVWILRSDAAFEEEAALQAEKAKAQLARVERPQPRLTKKRTARFSLAPRGPAETAILWKNWLLFTRASGANWSGVAVLLLCVVGFLVAFGTASDDPVTPVLGVTVTAMTVLLGPAFVRVDLRTDLANLPLIKTWPVAGAAIIRGEVLAPAIALTAAALAGVLLSGVFAPAWMLTSDTFAGRLGLIVSATTVACALIVTQLVIQNGLAVVFPAWIRIAPVATAGGGVEIMGQSVVVMYGSILLLIVAALVPAASAAILFVALGGTVGPAALFAALMFIECYVATELLGRVLDRTDLQEVTVGE